MKIYTKTGDSGNTSLYGGTRVPKYDKRIEAYGTLDELNSFIGLLRDQEIDEQHKNFLIQIQNNFFTIGAILATPVNKEVLKNGKQRLSIKKINTTDILKIEQEIDLLENDLEPMTHFILPGGHQAVSYCHIARSVCRRTERLVNYLHNNEPIDTMVLAYLNRLSDYLFVLARMLSKQLHVAEIKWIPTKE